MTSVLRRGALILICSALAACATGDGDRPDGPPRGEHGPRRPLPNVFISLSGEPFRAAPGAPYPVVDWFKRADTDHDGRLTRAEAERDGAAFFARLDANHDGVLDGLEVQDYEQTVAPEILPRIEGLHAQEGMDQSLTFGDPNNTANRGQERGRGMGQSRQPEPPRGIGVQGAAVYSFQNAPEPVAAADAELDGRITRAEFVAAVDRRFDELDKTHVGFLTLAGLPQTPIEKEIVKRRTAAAKARRDRTRSGRNAEPDQGPGEASGDVPGHP